MTTLTNTPRLKPLSAVETKTTSTISLNDDKLNTYFSFDGGVIRRADAEAAVRGTL